MYAATRGVRAYTAVNSRPPEWIGAATNSATIAVRTTASAAYRVRARRAASSGRWRRYSSITWSAPWFSRPHTWARRRARCGRPAIWFTAS